VSAADCKRLALAAGVLFQWAFVACDVVLHPPGTLSSKTCVHVLLKSSDHPASNDLDELYVTVLNALFSRLDGPDKDRFQFIMSMLLSAFEPLSQETLSIFARFAP
jgi:hypothetical protein